MSSQIIKFKWHDWQPKFVIDDYMLNLFGSNISFKIGVKKCIGHVKKGKRIPCDNIIDEYNYSCPSCQKKDDYFGCVQCSGECINPSQRTSCMKNKYSVYLATFGDIIKIGISIGFRLKQRLVEQGADFGAKIMEIEGGREVRKVEQSVRRELGIVDRVTGDDKMKHVFANPNKCLVNIHNTISKIQSNGFSELPGVKMNDVEIFDLRNFYNLNNVSLSPTPLSLKEGDIFHGSVVAAKGNILIVKNSDYHSINAHRLVGRNIAFL